MLTSFVLWVVFSFVFASKLPSGQQFAPYLMAGILMNTAIAGANNPILMASAMKKAVEAGREAFLAGRMAKKLYSATPSSPTTGLIA